MLIRLQLEEKDFLVPFNTCLSYVGKFQTANRLLVSTSTKQVLVGLHTKRC